MDIARRFFVPAGNTRGMCPAHTQKQNRAHQSLLRADIHFWRGCQEPTWQGVVSSYTIVDLRKFELLTGTAANDIKWFEVNKLPKTGFDHKEIIKVALHRLKAKVTYQPIGFELVDKKFTLTELQYLYECILQRPVDKRNFRKRMLESKLMKPTGEKRTGLKNRAP